MATERVNDLLSAKVPLLYAQNHGTVQDDVESKLGEYCDTTTGGTTSFFKTCFNGLNALSGTFHAKLNVLIVVPCCFIVTKFNDVFGFVGVGILSVPYALASGGWMSLILLFIVALVSFYTSLLIRRCMDIDSSMRTYPDLGERAFGSTGRLIVLIVMCVELYLVATGFLILEGDNLHNLFPDVNFEIAGLTISGRQGFVVIVAIIVLPSVWLDNLSILSYVSATGVLASILIIVSIAWGGAFDGIGFQQKGPLLNWRGIPTAISLYAFCYCSHPVFPTLYTSMRNKRQFSNVMIVCFTICTISYASMAILGYLMFGSNVQSQVTLNLPTNTLSSKVAIYTALINPVSKYALMVTPIVNLLESLFPSHRKNKPFSILIRTILVISMVVVALAIPFFGSLMSLVGALLSLTGSVLLPCLCYLKISGTYQRLGYDSILIWGILPLGVSIAIVGTYTSVVEIIGS